MAHVKARRSSGGKNWKPETWALGWIVYAMHKVLVVYAHTRGRPRYDVTAADVHVGGDDTTIQALFMLDGVQTPPVVEIAGHPDYRQDRFVAEWSAFARWIARQDDAAVDRGMAPYRHVQERMYLALGLAIAEGRDGVHLDWTRDLRETLAS